jgi:hypothetical protein
MGKKRGVIRIRSEAMVDSNSSFLWHFASMDHLRITFGNCPLYLSQI